MHRQSINREFSLLLLAMPILLCLLVLTKTPLILITTAILMVAIGLLGWWNSKHLPKPWLIRLGATLLIVLGAAFLYWYFTGGRTILRPIFDAQTYINSMQKSSNTPQP